MEAPTRLPWSQRICFGVGHALNDLTASMWFSYLIVYLQLVLGFDSNYAGLILLVGQVADAIATPLLGYETSNGKAGSICRRYGRRKFLHLIGTICVLASFPFIFSTCPGCEKASEGALTVMLIPMVVVFQFGWAATQVSHLSLIPAITPYEHERDFLNVFRYAVDIVSDISTYVVVWLVFDLTAKPVNDDGKITSEYADKFMLIAVIVMSIGAFFSLIFHIGLKEVNHGPPPTDAAHNQNHISYGSKDSDIESFNKTNLHWKDWLKEIHFYQVGLLYMFTRLYQNMTCVFTPLYLQESLGAHDDFIAKIPLVMNVSGFVVSCCIPKLFKLISKKPTFLIGAVIGIGASVWILFGEGYPFCNHGIYGVAVLMGTASSMLVVCSLSFIHDLIGTSVETGAFVYGCMSFWDKMANGIAGMVVQHLHSVMCKDCDWFYKEVLAYGVGGITIVASVVLISLLPAKLGTRSAPQNRVTNLYFKTESVCDYDAIDEAPCEIQRLLPHAN